MVTRRTLIGALFTGATVLASGCSPRPAPSPAFTACESLNTLAVGSRAIVGAPPVNSFQPPTMDLGMLPFTLANGTVTSSGQATIQNGGRAGGSGNEVAVNNVLMTISVGFGQTLEAVRFSFGEYGGNLNASVNNQFVNFGNFSQIHGTTVGGVKVNVLSGGLGNDRGQIEFVGHMIDQASGRGQLAIGGQELWIDDICVIR